MSYIDAEIKNKQYQAWDVLVDQASHGLNPMMYKDIADKVGLGENYARKAQIFLHPIQDFCLLKKIPPLTVLAKLSVGGYGKGFSLNPFKTPEEAIVAVHGFKKWNEYRDEFYGNVTTNSIEVARNALAKTQTEKSTRREVEQRGSRQEKFKNFLLLSYAGQCAVCDIKHQGLLDGAHIISWSASTAAEKVDSANGLLLCKNHHASFDAKLWWVDQNGEVCTIASDLMKSLRTNLELRLPKETQDSPMSYLDKYQKRHKLKV
jgi:putative restriction endonuclease